MADREKVEFPINETVILRLDFKDGVLSPGNFGDQYRYTFDGGTRVAWLDPDIRTLIQRTGAGKDDEIGITKREVKEPGKRKRVQWEVQLVQEEPAGREVQRQQPPQQQRKQETALTPTAETAVARKADAEPRQLTERQRQRRNQIDADAIEFAMCIRAAQKAAQLSGADLDIQKAATTIYINRCDELKAQAGQ